MDEFNKLITIPDSKRDVLWENKLLSLLPSIHVHLLSNEPQVGPDGWPYLFVETHSEAKEPIQKILFWLAERGIGLALNPSKTYPDYVLTYGMIWHYRHKGQFEPVQQEKPKQEEINFSPNQKVFTKKLTEVDLPFYSRKIIKEFFRDQGVYSPKGLFFSKDGQNFDFAISKESLGSPPKEEVQGIMEALSWFFPHGVGINLMNEDLFPQFELL